MRALHTALPVLILLCWGCGGPAPEPSQELLENEPGQMVWVIHEGNFRMGNAGMGWINLRTGAVQMQQYRARNGRSPGDVLQSAAEWNGSLWLVLNNSGFLQQTRLQTLEAGMRTEGLTSPRYLLPLSPAKAWCSDLYARKIWILNAGQNRPSGWIPVPGWTEEMAEIGGRVFAVCRDRPLVLVLDPATDQLTDSIPLPGNATSLAPAGKDEIWIGFEAAAGSGPGVGRWNTRTLSGLQTVFLPAGTPDRFASSQTGDTLFFLAGAVCRLQKGNPAPVTIPVPRPAQNLYGLGWDPARKQIWVSDARDYVQNSRIYQLSAEGNLLKEWEGGPITSRFYFR